MDIDRHVNHTRNFYDRNWSKIPVKFFYDNGPEIEKPNHFQKLLSMAEKLASEFDFVRVDFYILKGQIFFGEMTFHPESGLKLFTPYHYEQLFGSYLNLQKNR